MKPTIMFRLAIAAWSVFAFAPISSAQPNLGGDWTGTIDVNGNTVHVAWHIQVGSNGTLTSTLDNIDESVYGIKVKSTTIDGAKINFSVDEQVQANGQDLHLLGSFAGTVAASGNEINGTFTQEEPQQATLEIHFVHAASTASSTASAASTQPSIAGDWSGTLDAGGAQLRLLLHITAGKDGSLSATLDSIDQGANGIPIQTVTFKDGKLHLDVTAVNGTYDGNANKDATEIDGTWTQGQSLTLNLKRAQPTAAAAPQPATPTDIDGTWSGKLETGAAMLTINLKIANMDTGLTAQIQSPDQSPNWAPATSITRTGDSLTVEFKAFHATYEGKISADHSTIDGKFNQMGNDLPLVLKKI